MTTHDGHSNISPLRTTTPHIEKRLVRDERNDEFYLPLTSTVVLKRRQEMPLDFYNNITIDALVDSGTYVTAIAQDDLDTIKQKAPNNIFKIDDRLTFQMLLANCQLEKPLTTVTFKFVFEDNTFAEYFVVVKKLTDPILGLYFMRNNSVVIDTTHGFILFPHLTMQINTTSEMSAKTPSCPNRRLPDKSTKDKKNRHNFCWPSLRMDTTTTVTPMKIHGNSQSAYVSLNVNSNWQDSGNESNQYNRNTVFDQKKHTICRFFRSHSETSQVH